MDYEQLKGLSKTEIKERLGSCYNDYFSDIWMFRAYEKNCFFCRKYLYLFFEKGLVKKIEWRRFKANYLM